MSDSRNNRARGIALEDLDVVVVDDSKPMQTIVRSMLNAARVHRVRTFDNAGDAYRAMLVEPPHLLITDWNLPDTDGLALVRSLRDPRSGPLVGVPVILITGHATRDLVEKAIASGIHYVLAKPLSPSSVLKRIAAALADERRFVLDRTRGCYVLQGADELLAGQRQRWRELQDGTLQAQAQAHARRIEARSAATEAKSAPPSGKSAPPLAKSAPVRGKPGQAPAEVARTPAEAAPATQAPRSRFAALASDGRRRAIGLGAPIHKKTPVETSTGQPSPQAS